MPFNGPPRNPHSKAVFPLGEGEKLDGRAAPRSRFQGPARGMQKERNKTIRGMQKERNKTIRGASAVL